MRIRYATDRERVLSTNKAWYERNRERMLDYDRRQRLANLDAIRAKDRERSRARYAADPAAWQKYLKEWRQKNPDKTHAYVRTSHSKRHDASKSEGFTSAEWLALLKHHGGRCAYSGSDDKIEIDHRIPLIRGGSNPIDNILPARRRCNRRKHHRTEEEFRELLQRERRQGLGLGLLDGNAGTTRS
jgi:5-methylcytosine-specific restriction endonuclease McrA